MNMEHRIATKMGTIVTSELLCFLKDTETIISSFKINQIYINQMVLIAITHEKQLQKMMLTLSFSWSPCKNWQYVKIVSTNNEVMSNDAHYKERNGKVVNSESTTHQWS